jgi:hypothetical protein
MQTSIDRNGRDARPSRDTRPSSNPALSILKALLGFDALTCMLLGALLLVTNAAAARLTGLPAPLLMEADSVLLVFGAFVAWAAIKKAASRLVVMAIVDANILWALASIALVIFFAEGTTAIGRTLVLVQGIAVGVLAIMEFTAWRRVSR